MPRSPPASPASAASPPAFPASACLPAEPAAVPSQPVPARPRRPVHPGIKVGAGVTALIAAAFMMLVVLMGVSAVPVVAFTFIAVAFGGAAAIVASVPIVVVLKLEARRRNRSGGQLPPRQSPGTPGQAPRPAIGPPPTDRDHPAAEAARPRPPAARRPAIACASH